MDSNELPGTIPQPTNSHPRRPPAHKSVSLRHSPPAQRLHKPTLGPQSTTLSTPTAPASDKANPPSSVSPNLATNKQSSGESSDAGKWFENANNNAIQSNASFAADNDPPFFLRNSSSSGTSPEGIDSRSLLPQGQSATMPYRPGLTHMETDGSSTEEFRSVIDDLTIANKRLKQKLRKYEKLYDNKLQDEKLFEVRFHGLPDHKKRELEETLRKFAADLDTTPGGHLANIPQVPALESHQSASSTSRFAESGYASMSGNQSYPPSGQDSDRQNMSKSQYKSQQQNIQSYLHDIPASLLPKQNMPMTEKSRKKLVVRRLEQIFAGKRQVPGNHAQPMQQEEVAQSAAKADRRAKEASGQQTRKEGFREARIMPAQPVEEHISLAPQESLQQFRPSVAVNEHDFAGNTSPDQRPTRPLDLDLYRAQVPADNMEYIRHLGFTPPNMQTGESPEEGHGWIYLNLLINMAQLHTINVTPDFIKEALSDYSSKFELSHDGRKVRWKGGYDLTRGSENSSEHLSGISPNQASASSESRLKTGTSGDSTESMIDLEKRDRHAARAMKEEARNKLAYTPIFFQKQGSEDDDEFYNYDMVSSSNSPFMAQQRGDSSGFSSSAMRSSSSRKRRDDGPIIFYNRAKFCTDLTGDRHASSLANPASNYKPFSMEPLGGNMRTGPSDNHITGIGEPKGPFAFAPMEPHDKDSERVAMSSGEDIDFSPPALRSDSREGSASTMEFVASGIGGVQPEDNFTLKVRRSQVRVEPSKVSRHKAKTKQLYPKNILTALNERRSSEVEKAPQPQPTFSSDITSISRKDLPSSTLPPASFLPFDSTSSGDVDSDLESDVSSNPSSSSSSDHDYNFTELQELRNISPLRQSGHPTTSQAQAQNFHQRMDVDQSEGESSADESDDSNASVDLLAIARELDPMTIRASEREYDAEFAERFVEEIPAGSSAATAGGGSGFNTPMSSAAKDIGGDDEEEMKMHSPVSATSSQNAKTLKRARTSDNIAKSMQQPEKSQKLG